MKRIFTFAFAALVGLSVSAQVKVGYFGSTSRTMETTIVEDPILTLLNADANFTVTVTKTAAIADNPTITWADYDVILVQESNDGSATILKPAGSLGLASITKPCLYNKAYAFKSGRALSSGDYTGNAGTAFTLNVPSANQSNDLFKGITFDATNLITIFNAGATDAGATGTKGLNYVSSAATATTELVSVSALATPSDGTNVAFCVNDIPSGTTFGGVTTAARIVTVGFNYGAMVMSAGNFTNNGLTIMRNAIYSLAGLTVPTTIATLPTVSVPTVQSSELTIVNPVSENLVVIGGSEFEGGSVTILDAAGKVVAKDVVSASVNVASLAKGLYFAKFEKAGVAPVVKKFQK